MDENGYVKIVDRKKDMIVVSGFKVFPNELEDVIARHPGVLEVAAIGVPDEHSGEVPKLFVVKKDPNADGRGADRLLQGELDRLQAPEIHRVPDRTAEEQCRQDFEAGAEGVESDERSTFTWATVLSYPRRAPWCQEPRKGSRSDCRARRIRFIRRLYFRAF